MAVVESLAKGQARQLCHAGLSLEQDRPIDRLVMEAPQAPDEATLEEVEGNCLAFLKASTHRTKLRRPGEIYSRTIARPVTRQKA